MNKFNALEKKIVNSNFKVSKNFVYKMIAPLIILLVGIILICTIGFNLGADFTGYSSFKVYVNAEESFVDADVYDLNDSDDYNTVYNKVLNVLEENNLKLVSYRTSSINLKNYNEPNGQAVEVLFQNSSTKDNEINEENSKIREDLLVEFDYKSFEDGITSVDFSPAQPSFSWAVGILAAMVFALASAIIYMMFRYNKSAWIVMILQVSLDILLFLSLLSIFRLTINFTVGISLLATFVISLVNLFTYYSKMKENINTGKYSNMKNNEMADRMVRESLLKKIIAYVVLAVLAVVFAIISVEGVREVSLGILIGLIVTFATSTFLTPAVWMVAYKEKKNKKQN